ncbi:MAG: hypothetical protein KU37_04305 [Sulfuricurvum sp. PC08-66]|nr:MAG: hypothetical protein KU37_04305 [Sulfuricurvum sp. PC08-66]
MRKLFLIVATLGFSWGLTLGEPIPAVHIGGKEGGYVKSSTPFSSTDFLGQVNVVMYMDPDNADDGKNLVDALKEAYEVERINRGLYKDFVLIDFKSTWKPNFLLASAASSRQKRSPMTRYVIDKQQNAFKAWGMQKRIYDCIVIDEQGVVRLHKRAPFSDTDIEEIIGLVARLSQY